MKEGCAMATMLIIEENEKLRGELRALLEAGGYEVQEARHGCEGVAWCATHAIDVVVADLRMPEEDGCMLMRALWAMPPAPKLIALAGGRSTARRRLLEDAAALGADRTLRQPIRAQDLLTAVQELLAET